VPIRTVRHASSTCRRTSRTAARNAVYEALSAEADAALAAGRGVIAATFLRRADRRRLAEAAGRHRCRCVFVECRADEELIRARREERATRPSLSDARWET
jgi:predicted kinase